MKVLIPISFVMIGVLAMMRGLNIVGWFLIVFGTVGLYH